MEKGIRFKLVWEDSDLLEIALFAWNGEFGGLAHMYLGHGELVEIAKSLGGFPQSSKDERRIEMGDFNSASFGGAILRFYTKDMAGHAAVEISLHAGAHRAGHVQTVTLHAPLEAAALDDFVTELRKLEDQVGSTAFLKTNL